MVFGGGTDGTLNGIHAELYVYGGYNPNGYYYLNINDANSTVEHAYNTYWYSSFDGLFERSGGGTPNVDIYFNSMGTPYIEEGVALYPFF
jgi:hypothetical protein